MTILVPAKSSQEPTEREMEVLTRFLSGSSWKEIAYDMHLSVKTVDAHKSSLMRKWGVHTSTEMALYAVAHGIARVAVAR